MNGHFLRFISHVNENSKDNDEYGKENLDLRCCGDEIFSCEDDHELSDHDSEFMDFLTNFVTDEVEAIFGIVVLNEMLLSLFLADYCWVHNDVMFFFLNVPINTDWNYKNVENHTWYRNVFYHIQMSFLPTLYVEISKHSLFTFYIDACE